jgi:hypothetical protein
MRGMQYYKITMKQGVFYESISHRRQREAGWLRYT